MPTEPSYDELIAVFMNAPTVRSIGLTKKRVDVILRALRIAKMEEPMTDEKTPAVGVPIVLAFDYQRIADMVVTAIESPVGDWFRGIDASRELRDLGRQYNDTWYAAAQLYARDDFQFTARVENPDKGDDTTIIKTLRMEDFQRALILMATKDEGAYSRHFADFLRSNEDASTADLFMQFAVYGDEVYA